MRFHLKMISGDLKTFEQKSKYQGGLPHCRLCGDQGQNIENLEHILTTCSAYTEVRTKIMLEMSNICNLADVGVNFQDIQSNPHLLTQFILDCTSFNLPRRINYSDSLSSEIFNLSRQLCHHISKTRLKKLRSLQLK